MILVLSIESTDLVPTPEEFSASLEDEFLFVGSSVVLIFSDALASASIKSLGLTKKCFPSFHLKLDFKSSFNFSQIICLHLQE